MRDLAKDLEGIQAKPTEWRELPTSIILEYIKRAIDAENLLASHAPEGHNVTNMQYQELRAENAELKRKLFDAETRYQATAEMVEILCDLEGGGR